MSSLSNHAIEAAVGVDRQRYSGHLDGAGPDAHHPVDYLVEQEPYWNVYIYLHAIVFNFKSTSFIYIELV